MRTQWFAPLLAFVSLLGGFGLDELRHSSFHSSTAKENGVVIQTGSFNPTAKHLVFGCMDRRVRRPIANWIDREFDGEAELLSWPGVSEVVNNVAKRSFCLEALADARRLKGTTVVHLMNHIDCGGHGGSAKHNSLAAEREYHIAELGRAAAIVLDQFPELEVHLYLIDLSGAINEVTPVESPVTSFNGVPDDELVLD